MQTPVKTNFAQIGYGHLNNYNTPICYATVGMIMKQLHESSLRSTSSGAQKMCEFSKAISSEYIQMTRGQLTIYDKIVRGTLLNGPLNNGYLKKHIGKYNTYIHRVSFGQLLRQMLIRIDYILDNFDPDHEAFPFKSPKLQEPFNDFMAELTEFADFLDEKCQEWKKLFESFGNTKTESVIDCQSESEDEDEAIETNEPSEPSEPSEPAEPTESMESIILVKEGVVLVT